MADSDVEITAGSGTKIDTRTVGTDEHRQVVVIGDPENASRVAFVDSQGGLVTRLAGNTGNLAQVSESTAGLLVSPTISNGNLLLAPSGDALTATSGYLGVTLLGYNGTTWDRVRTANTGRLQVDVVTAPTTAVTGTFWQATQPVSAASLPLPSGASTETTLSALSGKFPTTAALADATANPTISRVGSFLHGYNGTTWDRVRTANTGRLQTDARIFNSVTGLEARTEAAADGLTTTTGLVTIGAGLVFNGSSWDRVRNIGAQAAADANTGIQAVATIPHKTGYTIASATARYTATQTSTTLGPTVSASQRMVVTSIQIQAGGTTIGEVVVYFGTGAYTRGTNAAVFDGSFTPSATNHPGYAQSPPVPYMGAADAELKVTTSAAINPLTVTVWYYLVAV
jgi:hypothetical protein